MRPKALIAWSSGKDSAWALHEVRRAGDVEVVGALTTVTETFQRVSMHGVREDILRAQHRAIGLPSAIVPIQNRLLGRCAGLRRAGACALDLAYVAGGRLDGFFVMSLKAWDIAAGALLVKEAGGRVGDFAGGTDFLRRDEVIAAAPGLFNPLREAIAG